VEVGRIMKSSGGDAVSAAGLLATHKSSVALNLTVARAKLPAARARQPQAKFKYGGESPLDHMDEVVREFNSASLRSRGLADPDAAPTKEHEPGADPHDEDKHIERDVAAELKAMDEADEIAAIELDQLIDVEDMDSYPTEADSELQPTEPRSVDQLVLEFHAMFADEIKLSQTASVASL
jgi:hypothetical protein